MWQDGFDINEDGQRVKLYKPVEEGPSRKNTNNPKLFLESHAGGISSQEEDPPSCGKCGSPMLLLVQLNLSKVASKSDGAMVDRNSCVFGCPKSRCFSQMKFSGGFSSSSEGIMTCRSTESASTDPIKARVPVAPVKSAWYSTNDESGDTAGADDWGMEDGDDAAMGTDDLEKAVAAMEVNAEKSTSSPKPKVSQPKPSSSNADANMDSSTSPSMFECFALTVSNEPDAPSYIQQVEEDDVGVGGVSSVSDEKIRNMLARYMAEEEDEEILSALRGTTTNESSGGAGGGGGREHDERLSLRDRVLRGFQDRISRFPRQVVRYAPGGVPIWSIPLDVPSSSNKKKKKDKNSAKSNSDDAASAATSSTVVPPCKCGAQRIFQFQLLPSLLHVLKVDQFSEGTAEKSTTPSAATSGISALLSGGMDWGAVAVYSCSNSCSSCKEDYLLIQETVDELPDIPREEYEDPNAPMAVVEDMDDDAEFQPDA